MSGAEKKHSVGTSQIILDSIMTGSCKPDLPGCLKQRVHVVYAVYLGFYKLQQSLSTIWELWGQLHGAEATQIQRKFQLPNFERRKRHSDSGIMQHTMAVQCVPPPIQVARQNTHDSPRMSSVNNTLCERTFLGVIDSCLAPWCYQTQGCNIQHKQLTVPHSIYGSGLCD